MSCDYEIIGKLGDIYFSCACGDLCLSSSCSYSYFGGGAVYVDHGRVSGEVDFRSPGVYYAGGL